VKPCLSGSGSRAEVVKVTPPRVRGIELFPGNNHNQVLRDGNKNSVPKRETHKRTDTSSTVSLDSPLDIILKFFLFFESAL
jgi:hypothetical protein